MFSMVLNAPMMLGWKYKFQVQINISKNLSWKNPKFLEACGVMKVNRLDVFFKVFFV